MSVLSASCCIRQTKSPKVSECFTDHHYYQATTPYSCDINITCRLAASSAEGTPAIFCLCRFVQICSDEHRDDGTSTIDNKCILCKLHFQCLFTANSNLITQIEINAQRRRNNIESRGVGLAVSLLCPLYAKSWSPTLGTSKQLITLDYLNSLFVSQ